MIRKLLAAAVCFLILLSAVSCGRTAFTELSDGTIKSEDGVEYICVGMEYEVACLGKWEFLGYVAGEKKYSYHLDGKTKTGMFSVNGSRDVLVRSLPNGEFNSVYVKSDLLETDVSLDSCVRFGFLKDSYPWDEEATVSPGGITECKRFLEEIRSGQTVEEAGLFDLIMQPDGRYKNYYLCGYACGIVQEGVNLVIPLQIRSFNNQAYSIEIDGVKYVLPKEWLDQLTAE